MKLGITEIIFCVLVLIALFKPEKLKDYIVAGKKAAKVFRETKANIDEEVSNITDTVTEVKDEINKEIYEKKSDE